MNWKKIEYPHTPYTNVTNFAVWPHFDVIQHAVICYVLVDPHFHASKKQVDLNFLPCRSIQRPLTPLLNLWTTSLEEVPRMKPFASQHICKGKQNSFQNHIVLKIRTDCRSYIGIHSGTIWFLGMVRIQRVTSASF